MKHMKWLSLLLVLSLLSGVLAACGTGDAPAPDGTTDGTTDDTSGGTVPDDNDVTPIAPEETVPAYTFVGQEGDTYVFRAADGAEESFTFACTEGTAGSVTVSGTTLFLSGLTTDAVYTLSGKLYGNIVVEGNEDYKLELSLCGASVRSEDECPLRITGCDKVTLAAKKDTENYLYDMRAAADTYASAVYADCDLALQGKGALYVYAKENNGVHTKDDLTVKNLSLQVECVDNALKGNDSVTVESGTLVLIARQGDGIKTTNTDLSSKGKQRGSVALLGGDILIYAATDGIDAAYDVTVGDADGGPTLQIFTDRYSKYSEEIAATDETTVYLRTTTTAYAYAVWFENEAGEGVFVIPEAAKSVGRYYYYPLTRPSGYGYMRLCVYTAGDTVGEGGTPLATSERFAVNESYDTLAVTLTGSSLRLSFTNYTTASTPGGPGGGMGGPGGMNEGNPDKSDRSTKGIKAGNALTVAGGSVTVCAYDDALHANAAKALENGETSVGTVTVSGGTLTLSSHDDAVHGDGDVTVSGGTVTVTSSYEGIEGARVTVAGGSVSVTATDDGLNGVATEGTAITLSGGTLYVRAGGDGLDANSRTAYAGIVISGGRAVIISTGGGDSAIDTEAGYRYTGGTVVAIGQAGGMSGESTTCSPDFSTVGRSASLRLTSGQYLSVGGLCEVTMPVALNAFVVCLGTTTAAIGTVSSLSGTPDGNGVVWL